MLFNLQLALGLLPILARAAPSSLSFQSPDFQNAISAVTGEPVHGISDFSQYTILEILDKALHHHRDSGDDDDTDPGLLPLHLIAYFVNKSSEAQKTLSGDHITFFAPDDDALTPPHHRNVDAATAPDHPFHDLASHVGSDGSDEDRRERFARIVGYLIKYHVADKFTTDELADKATVATSLVQSNGEALRVRVEASYQILPYPHPILNLNFFSKKVGNTILAKNGIIHLINHPLLPPFTPLNDLYLFPTFFSILTNAIQKVDLATALLPAHSNSSHAGSDMIAEALAELKSEHGGKDFTIFSPTNFAFDRLGLQILAFLHSPFPVSKHALKLILAYHVVPDVVFHSDYQHDDEHKDLITGKSVNVAFENHNANVTHYKLKTLLATSGVNSNGTMDVDVVAYRRFGKGPIVREVIVRQNHHGERNGEQDVKVWKADGVARNGALHALNTVLRPPYNIHHEHHGEHERSAIAALDRMF